jgi:hypothetical protein
MADKLRIVSTLFIMAVVSDKVAANCGPFNAWHDNDYCVSFAHEAWKMNRCPGGEAGRIQILAEHNGEEIQVTYWDDRPNTCQPLRPSPPPPPPSPRPCPNPNVPPGGLCIW